MGWVLYTRLLSKYWSLVSNGFSWWSFKLGSDAVVWAHPVIRHQRVHMEEESWLRNTFIWHLLRCKVQLKCFPLLSHCSYRLTHVIFEMSDGMWICVSTFQPSEEHWQSVSPLSGHLHSHTCRNVVSFRHLPPSGNWLWVAGKIRRYWAKIVGKHIGVIIAKILYSEVIKGNFNIPFAIMETDFHPSKRGRRIIQKMCNILGREIR